MHKIPFNISSATSSNVWLAAAFRCARCSFEIGNLGSTAMIQSVVQADLTVVDELLLIPWPCICVRYADTLVPCDAKVDHICSLSFLDGVAVIL